ncbi:GNAT family N-acetyltransferase [Glaciihabitans tibetensis]|nr:GNAT family protein [Glaciihabitans tibetensis]
MTAQRPDPVVLPGRFIQLVPLTHAHLPELFNAIGHEIVFASGYGGGPAGYRGTLAGFVPWAVEYLPWGTGNVFGVRISGGPHDGQLVGTTTLGDFDEALEHTHIGWTAYDPRVWGTQVNPEAKLLLLGHAFDSGFGRVKFQADAVNERSRAAITGIGATFEGIARRDKPRADGTWRDTAVFSVIRDDWSRVHSILTERLAPFEDRPVLFRTPPSLPNESRSVPNPSRSVVPGFGRQAESG